MPKRANVKKDINQASAELYELMYDQLEDIATGMINQIMAKARRATPATRLNAIKDLTPKGVAQYQALITDAMAVLSLEALAKARKEVPRAKGVELAETNIKDLPASLRKKITVRSQLLVGTQIADLQRTIEFAYATNEDTTDSDDQVEADLHDSALGWLNGPSLQAGSTLTASTVINQTREAFFWDDEVLEEIDAFEFVNGDPVTEICQDLEGTVFSKDDPNAFRYTPPLHWNCKSYIVPILKGDLGRKEITPLRPSKAALEDGIQFAEQLKHLYTSLTPHEH